MKKKNQQEEFDSAGRPVIDQGRRIEYKSLPANCGKVLYALALTELRGSRLGLTRRSIRKVLQHENDPLAGSWDWLLDPSIPDLDDGITPAIVRNAVHKILEEYPIHVLIPGTYVDVEVPGYLERPKGGVEPDVYMLNAGAIERWPCGAKIISLLATGIRGVNPLKFETLARYMPATHHSHKEAGQPTAPGVEIAPHALNDDIEFLVRARYLKLFTHERGDRRRKEIPHAQPMTFDGSAIVELDERALWEQTYLQRLAKHFE